MEAAGRLLRWQLPLMKVDYEVQHHPGRKQMAADALSWLSAYQKDDFDLHDQLPACTVADHHDEPDKRNRNEQKRLTIQKVCCCQARRRPLSVPNLKFQCLRRLLCIRKLRHPLQTCTSEQSKTKTLTVIPKGRGGETRTQLDDIQLFLSEKYIRHNETVLL